MKGSKKRIKGDFWTILVLPPFADFICIFVVFVCVCVCKIGHSVRHRPYIMLVIRLGDRASIRDGIVKFFATIVGRIKNCAGVCHVFQVVFEVLLGGFTCIT